jgi:hypothetical protein
MAMPTQTRESGFKTNPDYKILFESSPRRVRVKFNGEIIADSTNAHLLFETRHLPVYYFPHSDVRIERILRISSFGTGSGLSRRIDRVVRMISNRSAVFIVASDMAYSPYCLPS